MLFSENLADALTTHIVEPISLSNKDFEKLNPSHYGYALMALFPDITKSFNAYLYNIPDKRYMGVVDFTKYFKLDFENNSQAPVNHGFISNSKEPSPNKVAWDNYQAQLKCEYVRTEDLSSITEALCCPKTKDWLRISQQYSGPSAKSLYLPIHDIKGPNIDEVSKLVDIKLSYPKGYISPSFFMNAIEKEKEFEHNAKLAKKIKSTAVFVEMQNQFPVGDRYLLLTQNQRKILFYLKATPKQLYAVHYGIDLEKNYIEMFEQTALNEPRPQYLPSPFPYDPNFNIKNTFKELVTMSLSPEALAL